MGITKVAQLVRVDFDSRLDLCLVSLYESEMIVLCVSVKEWDAQPRREDRWAGGFEKSREDVA